MVPDAFVRALDGFEAVLAGVAPDRWDAPSPCAGWRAVDVAGHVISDLRAVEAYATLPPRLTGKTLVLTGKLPPPLFGLFMQQMRLRAVRRLPIASGWVTLRGALPPPGG